MKKILFLILILLIVLSSVRAEKMRDLDEVIKPELIEVAGERILITEGAVVYSYDINTFKFLKKFGRKGEGPGELKVTPSMANYIIPLEESILFAGIDKAIFYDFSGTLIREFKIPLFTGYLYPVKENFIGLRFRPGDKGAAWFELAVMDEELKDIKVFHKQKMSGGQNRVNLTFDGMGITVSDEKLYVENSPDGFNILVFDLNGNKLSEIKKEFNKVRFTQKMKEQAIEALKTHPSVRQIGWDNFKKIVKIEHDEFLPLIQDMVVDDGKIYVRTNTRKSEKVEFIVMDMKGKILKHLFLPEPNDIDFGNKIFGRPARFYKIYKGKYYYLKENIDEEMWELHKLDINHN